MPNAKTGTTWTPDIRPESIETVSETATVNGEEQSVEYKIVDNHPILNKMLDKMTYFRTHAGAVWYNKLQNITVLQKIDNIVSSMGTLSFLLTTNKSSLTAAVNELKSNIGTLSDLNTEEKGDLVGAISEVYSKIGNTYWLSGGIRVTGDLNNYSDPGNFYCPTDSSASTLLNCPTKHAFTMKIELSSGTDYASQTIREYNSGITFYRVYRERWREWQQIVTSPQIKNDWKTVTLTPLPSTQALYGNCKYNSTLGLLSLAINYTTKSAITAGDALFNIGISPISNREILYSGWIVRNLSTTPDPVYPATLVIKPNGDVFVYGGLDAGISVTCNVTVPVDGWFE